MREDVPNTKSRLSLALLWLMASRRERIERLAGLLLRPLGRSISRQCGIASVRCLGLPFLFMWADSGFRQEPEKDIEGHRRIRSTCKRCGASQLVSAADGTLRKWEEQHVCPDLPKKPPKFSTQF